MAFRGQFRRLDAQWYLEITPTYRFTFDGLHLDRFHEERLSTIKRIEGNRAVLSAVLFWAHFLRGERHLFDQGQTPALLRFGDLLSFGATSGLDDARWSDSQSESQPADDRATAFLPGIELGAIE
jgi:hypothetical protein